MAAVPGGLGAPNAEEWSGRPPERSGAQRGRIVARGWCVMIAPRNNLGVVCADTNHGVKPQRPRGGRLCVDTGVVCEDTNHGDELWLVKSQTTGSTF